MSSLSDISTYDNVSASITSKRRSSSVKTIPREEHTSYLTDTAGAVREVAKKLGKKKKKRKEWTQINYFTAGKTRVKWENPKTVMLITKPGDRSLIPITREVALYLIETPRYDMKSGITV